ncbi:MAG: hypothetical protein Q4G36_09930 [Paracoccus sp. (in: a-proteobacteria)]|nr:hypothetical protein [Paracoccus sp. (in: a-proteobacteria)]
MPRTGFRPHVKEAGTRTKFTKLTGRQCYPVAIEHGNGPITMITRGPDDLITSVDHSSDLRLMFDNSPDGLCLSYRVIGIDGSTQRIVTYRHDRPPI